MRYTTDVDRWLSHETRMVRAGEEFDTEFPKAADGKPMRLGNTLREVKPLIADKPAKAGTSGDSLV